MDGEECSRGLVVKHAMDEEGIDDGVSEAKDRGKQLQDEADGTDGPEGEPRRSVELIEAQEADSHDEGLREREKGGGHGDPSSVLSGLPLVHLDLNCDVLAFLESVKVDVGLGRFDHGEIDAASVLAVDVEHSISSRARAL